MIVGKRWLLSKPIPFMRAERYQVKMGLDNRFDDSTKWHQVEAVYDHPNYDIGTTSGYMLALIKLSEELDLDQTSPLCLPCDDQPVLRNGTESIVVGWSARPGGKPYPQIQQVVVRTLTVENPDPETGEDAAELRDGKHFMTLHDTHDDGNLFFTSAGVVRQMPSSSHTGPWGLYAIGVWEISLATPEAVQFNQRIAPFCDWIETTTGGEVKCVCAEIEDRFKEKVSENM